MASAQHPPEDALRASSPQKLILEDDGGCFSTLDIYP